MPFISQSKYRRRSGDPGPEGLVLTPGGYRHPSFVHHLPQGHKVRRRKQELQIVHRSSQRITQRHNIGSKHLAEAIIPGLGSGWVTSATWQNPTGDIVSKIETTWKVPPNPAVGDVGQIIYLFNGLLSKDKTSLLQPVLQWGSTAYGGGPHWSISNWYIDRTGHSTHSDFLEVPSDQVLTGFVALGQESDSDGLCSYIIGFTDYPFLNLSATNVDPLPLAVEVLESYHVRDSKEYPDTDFTSMSSIFIAADGKAPAISWTVQDDDNGCREHCSIGNQDNPGGVVEIHYF